MKSLNIVFTEKQKVEVLTEEFQAELGRTEILCKAISSLVSTGTELQCLRGVFDTGTNWEDWVKYPFHPGYSMVAEVLEVGMDVEGIRKGDRVFVIQSHNQFFKTEARSAYVLPEGTSAEQGTWLSLAITTQLGARRTELALGETVGIIGLGLLGQLVTQYLYLSGAKEIYAIDPAESRQRMLRPRPGIISLPMDANNAIEEIKRRTNGRMLDVVLDVTGHPSVLAHATRLVKPLGRVILLGDTSTPSQQEMGRNVVSNSVSIQGIHASMDYKGWNHPAMSDLFLSYLSQGRMEVDSLITHRYSPIDAASVYESLVNNRSSAMGVLFDWTRLI
ncbi:chlorophyll synthesis pathway protein BchC [Cohnella endophytica]|uniref:Chlorophyll synthesis pathway protein BchC n=1 Tax=Cohnella endophytica TaxID=2419778 RepID=A0A494Y0M8_9BACL|nr:zinc-binding alcohol dehydrogenase [Cohnella endophytica]RKP55548.1 chlorophyll synthesis pathway protein BchC [Cohnella endophytica]